MTVESIVRKAGPYEFTEGVSYPFYFKIFEKTDVYVVVTDDTGVETTIQADTDYRVVMNENQDNDAGGYVTLLQDYTGSKITIGSQVPYDQGVNITNKGGFYPSTLNKAYDKLTILCQQLYEQVSRCVKTDISSSVKPDELLDSLYESASSAANSASVSANAAEEAKKSAQSAANIELQAQSLYDSMEEQLQGAVQEATQSAEDSAQEAITAKEEAAQIVNQAVEDAVSQANGRVIAGRYVGEIIYSLLPVTMANVHLLDGSLLSAGGIYDAFISHVSGLQEDYPGLFVTEDEWQSSVSTYGVCGKFVYTESVSLRLPKVTGFIEGTLDVGVLGDLVEAGLPNIEGSVTNVNWKADVLLTPSGALTTSNLTGGQGVSSGVNSGTFNLGIDASLSSPIYGNSTTVQPQAIKGYLYIVVATSVKTTIEIDIDKVITDLNSKVDKDSLSSFLPKSGMQVFTGNGTFVVPDGVTTINVLIQGGGGGGGGNGQWSGGQGPGTGGASGGTAFLCMNVTSGEQYPVTVGSAGAPGVSANTSGGAGGTSSFGESYATGGGGGGASTAAGVYFPGTAGTASVAGDIPSLSFNGQSIAGNAGGSSATQYGAGGNGSPGSRGSPGYAGQPGVVFVWW